MNKRQIGYTVNNDNLNESSPFKRMRIPYNEDNNNNIQINEENKIEIQNITQNNNKISLNPFFQNIFSNNKNKEQQNIILPLCGTCDSILDEEQAMIMIYCQFCSHVGCVHCTPQCFVCGERFCKNCSLQNYDSSYERTICIDCNCSSCSNLFP